MSGFGAPSLTTTPTPTLATLTRLPATILPARGQAVDHGGSDDRDVERFAAFDAFLQPAGGVVIDDDLVAGLLFEFRHQRQHDLLEGAGGQHLDLSGGTRR